MFQLSEQQGLERCWGTTICSLQGKSFHRISGLSFMFILPNGICEKGTKTSVFLPLNPGGSHFLKSVLSPAPASEQLCLVVQTDIMHSQPPPLLHTFKLQSLKGMVFKKETSCIFQKTVQVLYWVDHTEKMCLNLLHALIQVVGAKYFNTLNITAFLQVLFHM